MRTKNCAYCGAETKGTKEHIISSGVLDLFPECFLTIDGTKKIVYGADPVIKDVCAECNNNRISYIDSYAKKIIEKYFVKKYEKNDNIYFQYDYAFMQKMLLKYAYNDLRVHKENVDFYDKEILLYLMSEKDKKPKRSIILLGGLAVNISPIPDYVFGNQKIMWLRNPILLKNSMVMYIDYDTGEFFLRDPFEIEKIEELSFSYVFRFNSGQFILLCFDKNISEQRLNQLRVMFSVQYPYSILNETGQTKLTRCTSEATYHNIGIIDVSWGQELFDDISIMRDMAAPEGRNYFKKMTSEWEKYEKQLAKEHKRK